MGRTVFRVSVSLLTALVVWNIIIGNFIMNLPRTDKESKVGGHYQSHKLIVSSSEGYGRLISDENGFNNDPGILNGKKCVLVLGDSHTESLQVSREENYVSQLNQVINKHYIAYNAGFSGNSMAEYLYYCEAYKLMFHPVYTVIQVTYQDFIEDATNSGKTVYIQSDSNRVYIKKNQSERQGLKNLKDRVIGSTPLLAMFYTKMTPIIDRTLHPIERPFLPIPKNGEGNLNKQTLSQEDIHLIKWEIEQVKRLYGNDVVILLLPYTPRIEGNRIIYTDFKEDLVFSKVIDQCHTQGVNVLNLKRAFVEMEISNKTFPRGFNNTTPGVGHLNKNGHAAVAKVLEDFFISHLR